MQRHLRRCAIALKREGLGKACALRLNLELKKAGITARGGSMVDATFTWALKLHEEQRPRVTLKAHQSKKGEPGVSDTRRIFRACKGGGLVHGVETIA